jgi:hypothetical protein
MAAKRRQVKYVWNGRKPGGVTAETVAVIVERLRDENGGVCPPQAFVDEARPEESPIHHLFTWDDGVAGELYRRVEARRIIAAVKIVVVERPRRELAPAFVHVKHATVPGGPTKEGYRSIHLVLQNREEVDQIIAEALKLIDALNARFRHVPELRPLWVAAEQIRVQRMEDSA